MSRAGILAAAMAAALRAMTDTCTIRRVTSTTTDPDTGHGTDTYATVYAGACRVQQRSPGATRVDVGQDSQLLLAMEVQLPITVTGIETGDEVTVDTSRDPDLEGRVFLVRDLAHKTDASSRRIGLQERT